MSKQTTLPKEYIVYLEFFGRKMKTKVTAYSEDEAKAAVKGKIIFHGIKLDPDGFINRMTGDLDNIFGVFK